MLIIVISVIAALCVLASGLHLSTSPYIPPKDADAVNWANTFAATLTADPAAYMLTAGDASACQAAADGFAAAYALGGGTYHSPVNPATKTVQTTQDKVDARVVMEQTLRPYAQQISRNAGISGAAKLAIGVNPRTSNPTPVPDPTTFPNMQLIAGAPLTLKLQYRDNGAVTGKAKPFGAIQLQVFAMTSETPITDPAEIAYFGTATKSPFLLNFGGEDANKVCYVTCRWITRTGKIGSFGPILHATVMTA